jgi:hypothetical protein
MRLLIVRRGLGHFRGLRTAGPRLGWAALSALLAACSLTNEADDLTGGPSGGGAAGSAGVGVAAGAAGASAGRGGAAGASGSGGVAGTGAAAGSSPGGGAGGLAGAGGGNAGAGPVGGGGSGAANAGSGGSNAGSGGSNAGSGGSNAGSGGGGVGGKAGTGGGAGKSGSGGTGGGSSGAGGNSGSGGTGGGSSGAGGSSGSGGTAGGTAGAGGGCPINDPDCDGVTSSDNCKTVPNPNQDDQDSDKIGDACDDTPGGPGSDTVPGTCGPGNGTPGAKIVSAPAKVCAGAPLSVSYWVGGTASCNSNTTLVAYRLGSSGPSTSPTTLATTTGLQGSIDVPAGSQLNPGDYLLEIRNGQVASVRVPLHVDGVGLSLTVPSPVGLEAGAFEATYKVTPPAGVTVDQVRGGLTGALQPVAGGTFLVTPAQLGKASVTVSVTSSDGCDTELARTVQVLTCNPVLTSKTKAYSGGANPLSSAPVLVCASSAYTASGGSGDLFLQPGASAKASGIRTIWAPAGATLDPGSSGILTIIFAGAKPVVSGGSLTFVQCPSISYDESALLESCPALQ